MITRESFPRRIKLAIDVLASALAFLAAAWIGARGADPAWLADARVMTVLSWGGVYALFALAAAHLFRLDRAPWRFVSAPDVVHIVYAAGVTWLCFLIALFFLNRASDLPRSTFALSGVLQAAAMMGVRLAVRLLHERERLPVFGARPGQAAPAPPFWAAGRAEQLDALLREMERQPNPQMRIVGLLVTDPRWTGQWIRGVEVIGLSAALEPLWADRHAHRRRVAPLGVLLADPPVALGLSERQITLLGKAGARLVRVEPRPVARPASPAAADTQALAAFLSGKRVLITGAGGRLGQRLCRQAARLGCAQLSVAEASEFALYRVHTALRQEFPDLPVTDILCDVRDRARLCSVVEQAKPDIILHAASLNAPGIAEGHPGEAFRTNVLGARNILDAAYGAQAQAAALISTTDIVRLQTIIGATRRLAELAFGAARPRGSGPARVVVRVHAADFQDGPEAIHDAALIILEAARLGVEAPAGDLSVMLAAGPIPAELIDLEAHRRRRAAGGAGAVHGAGDSAFCTPGEKIERTAAAGVYRVVGGAEGLATPEDLDEMDRLIRRQHEAAFRAKLFALVS